jgi:hypothetical protein
MDTWMAQPASRLDCRGAAAAVAAVAVGACSAMCLELIKWLMRQDGLGLPGPPPPPGCCQVSLSSPQGTEIYIKS